MCFIEEGGCKLYISLDTMNILEKNFQLIFNYFWLCLQVLKMKIDIISKGNGVRFPPARCLL